MRIVPSDSQTTVVLRDYMPYRSLPPQLDGVLESLRVRNVTAIAYQCSRNYFMAPRRIADDMFYYVVGGRGLVTVEDKEYEVAAGDAAHFARGVTHSARADKRDPLQVLAIHYDAFVFESLSLTRVLHLPDVTPVGMSGAFHEMANILCREYALRPAGWERGVEALLLRLLLRFIREHLPLTEVLRGVQWRETVRILPALDFMRKNLQRRISIDELAVRCHLSPPQFRRVFKRAMNATPNEYLRRLRLEEAARLLKSTDETIETIAARVGYADPSFFAHTFKALMKIPPGQYRTAPAV